MTKTKPLKTNSLNINSDIQLRRALGFSQHFRKRLTAVAGQAKDPKKADLHGLAVGVIGILETYEPFTNIDRRKPSDR